MQQTTGGLLVWRKLDNWTAFTNGSITWINGPFGLQARANTRTFPLGRSRIGTVERRQSGSGILNAGTAEPDAADLGRPSGHIEEFSIQLDASSDAGIQSVWWWATSTDDHDLQDTHVASCRASNPCRRTWDVSTPRLGSHHHSRQGP